MQGEILETIHLRSASGRRKYLTPHERKQFLTAAAALQPDRKHFCEVLYYTGCRLSEAYHLRSEHFDFNESVVIIETLKQRKKGVFRAVPVPLKWLKTLSPILQKTSLWDFSLKTGYRAVKLAMEFAGIYGVHASPKGLRHGFGIVHGQNKTNPRLLQRWMGHTSLDTTMIYLDAQGEEERNAAKAGW